MSTTNSDSLTFLIAQLRSLGLNPFLNVAPQNTTNNTISYPIVVVTQNASLSTYSINKGEYRFDNIRYNIAIYDNQSNISRIVDTATLIENALEGQNNIQINNSVVLSTYKMSDNGPLWLNKEHYWAMYLGWEIVMGNNTSGIVGGKLVISGTVDIPIGVSIVTIPAFGFIPSGVVVSVSKPASDLYNIFATVREDTINAGGCEVELSAIPDRTGYTLQYMASN